MGWPCFWRDLDMKRYVPAFFILFLSLLTACNRSPRSDRSFDQIRDMVQGKTALEIEDLLGTPDSRQPSLLGDERWLWWDYTYLGGIDYRPEIRGQVVHLQITFRNPSLASAGKPSYTEWRVLDSQDVSFLLPDGAR